MRLLGLDLERYGPFTDRRVAFRPGARLHVVLGANEAGKSSALSAVTDLLFGIEERTRYAFRHDMPLLRIGAEIAASDGRRLVFRRRKGRQRTLVDAADAALPDDALAPFLGGLTREVFCRAFGLDAASLRAGGREMIEVEGEVGASLFAAGSGLRGYGALQTDLEAEAERIFAPRRAKDRVFYQALDRYEEARRAIRETGLRAGDWRELNDEIAAAGERLDAVRAERETLARARARLERMRRAGPLLAEIDRIAAEAEADPGLIEAGDGWIDRLGAGLDALRAARETAARAEGLWASARADLDAVPAEAGLLAHAEEILAAYQGIARFDKDGTDLPRVQGEAAGFEAELARLAVRVGLPGSGALVAGQPSDAALGRVEVLIRDGQEIAATRARLARDLTAARSEHAVLAEAAAPGGAPVDPAPFREALRPFSGLRRLLSERDALDAAVRQAASVLRGQAARLHPPVADAAALAAAPLPRAETVASFRALLDGKERERALAAERLAAARRAAAATRRRMREREAGRPIASRETLARLRAERDGGFAGLRQALAAGTRADPGALAAFERAVDAADRAADDLAADAARVAEHASDGQRLAAEEAEASDAAQRLAGIEVEAAEGSAAWAELWQPSGIAPSSPAEMAGWLSEADGVIEAAGDLDERRIDLARRSERIAAFRAPLGALGTRLGLSDLDGVEAGLVLDRVEERIAALALRWDSTRDADARLREAAAAIARAEATLAEAAEREAGWRVEWDAALAAIGLPPEARPEVAGSALAAWRAVAPILAERDNRLARVAGLLRDMAAYRAALAPLVAALAPDLAETSASAAARQLQRRLTEAQGGAVRRRELERRRDEAGRVREAEAGALARAVAHLSALLAEGAVGCVGDGLDPAALAAAESLHARLRARRAVREALALRRAELARSADGLTEAELRADCAALTPDAIEAELARIAMDADDADRRGQAAFADRDRAERRREALEGGTGAELALAQRKAAEAEMQAHARHWAVLRLGGLLLGTAIARQRAGQQDPLLARAGALFAGLTGGAFDGLVQDYDAADVARLAGRRAGGETVHVEGLSEGTRDQLYLALRLAYLEDYAARSEPAPFIGDDLFLTFDDARTAHGLEALASVGERVQPILFTHHRHVADLARARLGAAVDVLEL